MTTLLTTPNNMSTNSQTYSAVANVQAVTCPACSGTGEISAALVGQGVSGFAVCRDCGGTGVVRPAAVPNTSVVEAAGWLIIDLELPGVVARDLDVVVEKQVVTIKSLPRVDAPETPVQIARDRMQPATERIIELPQAVDGTRSSAIRATVLDGVLRLVLPIERPAAETAPDAIHS